MRVWLLTLVVALHAQPAWSQAPAALPRVVVLATGGTIASRYDPAIGALAPAVTGAALVSAVPGRQDRSVEVEQMQYRSYDSADVWRRMANVQTDAAGDAQRLVARTAPIRSKSPLPYRLDVTSRAGRLVAPSGRRPISTATGRAIAQRHWWRSQPSRGQRHVVA